MENRFNAMEIHEPKVAGAEGILYPIRIDHIRFNVRVRLLEDGAWLVRIEDRGQSGAIADDPLSAYRGAVKLADASFRQRGLVVPWGVLEDRLCAAMAFATDVPLALSVAQWKAVGVAAARGQPIDPASIERQLRESDFVRQAFGVGSGAWNVTSARWDDFDRNIAVNVHFGRD